jgi:hypothetical protein
MKSWQITEIKFARNILVALTIALLAGCAGGETTVPPNDTSQGDTSINNACEAGQFYCNGTQLWTCKADLSGFDTQSCPGGCSNGTCQTQVCTPNKSECQSDKTLRTCKADGSGYDVSVCPGVCDAATGTCVAAPTACTAGEKVCSGTHLKTCTADGSAYESVNCPYGCENGACKQAACVAGTTQCNAEIGKEKEVQQCSFDSTQWVTVTTCSDKCENGVCVTLSCQPNTSYCDGDVIKECNADGTASTDKEDCEFGCLQVESAAPVCQQCNEGEVKCLDDSTLGACSDPLVGFTTLQSCTGGAVCAGGACVNALTWDAGTSTDAALTKFTNYAAACWLDGQSNGWDETTVCWTMDTTHLPESFTANSIESWFCDSDLEAGALNTLNGHTPEALLDASSEIYGCGLFDFSDFDVKTDSVDPGQALGHYCLVYDTYWGDEVMVKDCNALNE